MISITFLIESTTTITTTTITTTTITTTIIAFKNNKIRTISPIDQIIVIQQLKSTRNITINHVKRNIRRYINFKIVFTLFQINKFNVFKFNFSSKNISIVRIKHRLIEINYSKINTFNIVRNNNCSSSLNSLFKIETRTICYRNKLIKLIKFYMLWIQS